MKPTNCERNELPSYSEKLNNSSEVEEIIKIFRDKFVIVDMGEMGKAIGMTLNNERLFHGKEEEFLTFLRTSLQSHGNKRYEEGYFKGVDEESKKKNDKPF